MPNNIYDQTLVDLGPPNAGSSSGSAAPNPYDQTLEQRDAARETRLRSSVIKAQQTTPDRAAKVQGLAQRTGLPPDVIERNFDAIVQRAQIADTPYTQMQRETPALATWAEQPPNMAVAHDDLAQLGLLEWMLTAPQRAVRQGQAQVAYGQLQSESIRRPLTAEEHARLATLKAQMDEGGALGTEGHWFRGAITGAASQIPLWVGALMQGVKYAGPAAATAGVAGLATGGPMAAVPLFGLGWSAGMIAGGVSFTADIEAGLALDEFQSDKFKDELGQPLDPGVAKVAAAATGLINGLIEQSQIETLVKHIPGVEKLTSGGVRAAVRTALRVPTVRAALAQAAKTYVGTLASETTQEVAQRAVTILSGELAKVVDTQMGKPSAPSPMDAIYQKYPALRQLGEVQVIDSRAKGMADGRQLEFYPADETDNPKPGKPTIEVFNPQLQGRAFQESVAADMLHGLPQVDPQWDALRQQFLASLTPKQVAMNRRAYDEERQHGETRTFEQWMTSSRVDAFLRGYLFPEQNPDWQKPGLFTSEQTHILEGMRTHLQAASAGSGGLTRIPLRSFSDIGADLASEAAGALQSFSLMLAPGPLLESRVDLQRARQAAHNVNFFTALGEGVANSKTAQRSPQAAEAFLAQATKDGPLSHVYAPVDTWTTYWQGQGIDPKDMATRVTGDPQAYQQAVDTGQDLPIPTAKYAVTLAGTDHNAFFANELRLAPDQMNARESAAFAEQQLAAPTPAAAPDVTAPVAAIREPIVASFVAAGVPKATAESYATVFEHALPTIAERTGLDVQALVQQWLPQVQSGEAPVGDEQFSQTAPETAAFKAWFGDSKVVDQAGAPLVVYHGTSANFEAFDTAAGLGGSWFTESPRYAGLAAEAGSDVDGGGGQVLPVYLSLKNPTTLQHFSEVRGRNRDGAATVRELMAEGFDGAVGNEGQDRTFVVFSDTQIKSAIGNRGTYDPASPSILRQGERGKITFRNNQPPVITLFANRDLSTVLHEAGHLFLNLQGDMVAQLGGIDQATLTEQQRKFQQDYVATLDWLGVESRTQIGTEQHEQYARGFEAYLMEGKAPSLAMRDVFARFRAWLLGLYRSARTLNVELTPEMRGVFDRLLASDQAIAEAEQMGHLAPMFTTAESAGMTPERFERYRTTVADASRQAREQVDQRLLSEVQRTQQAEWQAQRSAQQTTVTAEVQQQPVYRALAAIRKGTNADGTPLVEGQETPPFKLSKAILVDRYGEDRVKALPRPYVYTVTGGLDPDFVAERFGFSSGDALLTAITEAKPMRDVIDAEVDRRMLAEHGSILLNGTLHETAQAATANEAREEVVRAEMRALNALKRTAAPFEAAGKADVAATKREQAYERRWLEAEARLRIAIAQGYKQVEIDALRDEVRQLEQQARGGARTIAAGIPPAVVIRDIARARIAGTRIRDLTPALFWSASRRAAQQAIDHAARQDFDAAITAKQQELVNLALYREAERAKEDIAARVAFAQGLTKSAARERLGLAGESYQDQVDGILDRYSLATVSQKALDRRASLQKWVAAQEAEGLTVDLPEALLEETRRTPYQELSVEEFVGVTDGLKQIVHLARLKNKLLKSADRRAFGAVRDGLVASIRDKNTAHPLPLEFTPQGEKWRRLSGWFAALRKIAMLARAMDGDVDGGPLWEAIIRPINAAADAQQARNRTEGAAYHAILEQHYPGRELGRMGELTHIPAIGASLSKEARLAVGLNQGTQGNRDRLLSDPKRRWNQSQVAAILDTLDRRDWAFIQDTWDFLNTFRPEIEAKQRRVTGVAPEMVEALPVETKFGPLRGGYYPLAYDSRLSIRAGQHQAATEITMAGAANYVRTTTRRGFIEERKQHVHLPLRLEIGVMFAHVDQVIHDLTHHEMLIDVTRLLRDAQVSDAILETRGAAVYQQFSTALQDIAIGSLADRNVMDRAASWMRRRTQLAMLGANLWTAAQQPLGLFNGMQRVGPQWVMRGMTRWLRDAASMENTSKWISEVSPMMRGRVETASPELLDLRTRLRETGGWFDTLVRQVSGDRLTQQTILDGYMWHIGMMQRVADIPTWLGQYEKSMAGGTDEATAIAIADQAVIDSQGGGQIKDLASVQRGGGMARLFTMFYSYGSTLLNANINAAEATNFKSPASVLTFLGHLALLNIMPAMATVALGAAAGRGTGNPDDPEWWLTHIAGEALSGALNGIVLVREATAAVQIALHLDPGVRGYEGPAGTRLFQLLTDLSVQIKQGEPDEALARAANNVAGVLFRYPALQVQRTVDGWTALEEGRTSNPLALVVGAPRKKQ